MRPQQQDALAGISLLAVGAYGILGPRINPSIALALPLRMDMVALALIGAAGLLGMGAVGGAGGRGRPRWGGAERGGAGGWGVSPWAADGQGRRRSRAWAPWVVAGGLLGAALVAPWAAVPWLVVPALVQAWAGRRAPARRERAGRILDGPNASRTAPSVRTGAGGAVAMQGFAPHRTTPGRTPGMAIALLAALLNCAVVTVTSAPGFRASPEEFETMDFRANALLADVPLHDVWVVELGGRPLPTLEDLGNALQRFSPVQGTPALLALGAIREAAVRALGWEDPRWCEVDDSFLHRLTESDRLSSSTEPGTSMGIWRVLYAFPREGAVETINGTAQVAVAAAIGEGDEGSRLFLSFRVREVNWTTPFYMRLIDPARRFYVYPSLLRQFAHTWEREEWDPAKRDSQTGEES